MLYTPSQLPFLEYKEMVRRIKRDFDKRGGHYPLEITMTDATGQQLTEHRFINVWDRNWLPRVMVDEAFQGPINFQIWEDDQLFLEIVELEVTFKRPTEQMNFEKYFASLDEAA